MTSKTTGKLSFILYEEKKAPKYFEITKSSLRLFIIGLPLITCLSVIAFLMVTLYTKTIKQDVSSLPSSMVKELQIKNEQLLQTNRELQLKNNDLAQAVELAKNKNPTPVPTATSENKTSKTKTSIESLTIFPLPPNVKDQSQSSPLSLKQNQLLIEKGKIIFSFGMANNLEGNARLNGYLIVMMKFDNALHFYPGNVLNKKLQSLHNAGEDFSFARFRPVKAVFPYKKKNDDDDEEIDVNILNKEFFFKVFIFSKQGNLLHQQIFRKKYKP